MLRTTVDRRHGVDLHKYYNLKVFMKNRAKVYKQKKAQVLTLT